MTIRIEIPTGAEPDVEVTLTGVVHYENGVLMVGDTPATKAFQRQAGLHRQNGIFRMQMFIVKSTQTGLSEDLDGTLTEASEPPSD